MPRLRTYVCVSVQRQLGGVRTYEETPWMLYTVHVLDEKVAIISNSNGKSLTTTAKKLPLDTYRHFLALAVYCDVQSCAQDRANSITHYKLHGTIEIHMYVQLTPTYTYTYKGTTVKLYGHSRRGQNGKVVHSYLFSIHITQKLSVHVFWQLSAVFFSQPAES